MLVLLGKEIMAPNAESIPPSTLKMKPPARRQKLHTVDMWLEDKRETDGAEGLWRVGNNLYDLTDFIQRHPGGPEWLQLSKVSFIFFMIYPKLKCGVQIIRFIVSYFNFITENMFM